MIDPYNFQVLIACYVNIPGLKRGGRIYSHFLQYHNISVTWYILSQQVKTFPNMQNVFCRDFFFFKWEININVFFIQEAIHLLHNANLLMIKLIKQMLKLTKDIYIRNWKKKKINENLKQRVIDYCHVNWFYLIC
jgi:hypothetical protein